MISPFFKALMAYIVPVFLYSDNNTWSHKKEKEENCITSLIYEEEELKRNQNMNFLIDFHDNDF